MNSHLSLRHHTGYAIMIRMERPMCLCGIQLKVDFKELRVFPREEQLGGGREGKQLRFLVEPPPAGAGGSPQQRDLPGLLTRDTSFFTVARNRFPPPAGAGGCQGAGLPHESGIEQQYRRHYLFAFPAPPFFPDFDRYSMNDLSSAAPSSERSKSSTPIS